MSNLFSFARLVCVLFAVVLLASPVGILSYIGFAGAESEMADIIVNLGYFSVLAMLFLVMVASCFLELNNILAKKQLTYEVKIAEQFRLTREAKMAQIYKKQWIEKRWNELLIETSKPDYNL